MKKLILLSIILIVQCVFGDIVVYNNDILMFKRTKILSDVRFVGIESFNDKPIVKIFISSTFFGDKYKWIPCHKILKLNDRNGFPIISDCNELFINVTQSERESSDGTTIFVNNENSLRPSWSYNEPKDPFKAGLLSVLFPSGGHYYNEEYEKGVIFFASTIFTLGIGIGFNKPDREPEIGRILLLASPIIHYISTTNAIKSSQKINELYYKEYVNKQNVQSNN